MMGVIGGALKAQAVGKDIGKTGGAALDLAGNIMEGQSRADQQINDYRNWAFQNTAMQINQAHETTMLQDQQSRQSAGAQVSVGASGMGLSSSNAMASLDNMFRAQSQEQRNQSVNQRLQQMQMQQNLNNQNAAYKAKSIESYIRPFSKAFSSLAGDSKSTSNYLGMQSSAGKTNESSAGKTNESSAGKTNA